MPTPQLDAAIAFAVANRDTLRPASFLPPPPAAPRPPFAAASSVLGTRRREACLRCEHVAGLGQGYAVRGRCLTTDTVGDFVQLTVYQWSRCGHADRRLAAMTNDPAAACPGGRW